MELKQSAVVFNEIKHEYYLDGKQLHGITPMIRRQLFPEEYRDVPEAVLKRAADRGTAIHKDCELIDVDDSEAMTAEGWEYMMMCEERELRHVASEYLVSDDDYFASKIDKIFEADEGVILADIKTTSKLNEAYVSWQLSIYAHLFERMNPDIPVKEIVAIWLKPDDCKYIRLERIGSDEVKRLMECEKNGEQFIRENPDCFPEKFMGFDKKLYEIQKQLNELEAEKDRIMNEIKADMIDKGSMHWSGKYVGITRAKDSVRNSFDTKRFKADNEALYSEYVKQSVVAGGITLKLK